MKITFKDLLLVVVTLTLAACTASALQAPAPTSTSVPIILPTPASVESLEERSLATIDIKYPDELAFVQGFIWVKTDDGHLIQVDPAANRAVGDIKVDTTSDPYHYCQGLGTDGTHIWACSASGDEDHRTIDVVRIDPSTQSVVETVKVGKIFDQFDMPFLLNQIWVLSGNGDKLVGIDVTTGQPNPAIDLGARCFQLAVTDKLLMAACASDNLVLQIDPEQRKVTERLTIQSPRLIAGTENGIWVVQDNAVVRLNPQSLEPVAEFKQLSNIGFTGDIFVTQDAVWLRQDSGFLYRINPSANQIVEQIKPDEGVSGGSVLITSDSIWTTASDDNLLIRLSLKK